MKTLLPRARTYTADTCKRLPRAEIISRATPVEYTRAERGDRVSSETKFQWSEVFLVNDRQRWSSKLHRVSMSMTYPGQKFWLRSQCCKRCTVEIRSRICTVAIKLKIQQNQIGGRHGISRPRSYPDLFIPVSLWFHGSSYKSSMLGEVAQSCFWARASTKSVVFGGDVSPLMPWQISLSWSCSKNKLSTVHTALGDREKWRFWLELTLYIVAQHQQKRLSRRESDYPISKSRGFQQSLYFQHPFTRVWSN